MSENLENENLENENLKLNEVENAEKKVRKLRKLKFISEDHFITLHIKGKESRNTIALTKKQIACFGVTATLVMGGSITFFSEYVSAKQELAVNQQVLQQVQLEKKQLETSKHTSLNPVQEETIQDLAKKATELEQKILELESVKTNLNEQLEGIALSSSTAPEIVATVEELLVSNEPTMETDFVTVIKTSYANDAFVLDKITKVEDQVLKTDLSFTSVATEAIETISAYSDIPSGMPIENGIFSSGYNRYGYMGRVHTGIDISTNGKKLPVIATAMGVVVEAGYNNEGYGNCIVIDHQNGYKTLYAHNTVNYVQVGDVVFKGDEIAMAGSTGNSTGIHCHYEITINDERVDPSDYL